MPLSSGKRRREMADADADGRGVDAGGNACTAAALELRRALGTALGTARAPTAEIGASRDLVNLVNAPTSDTLVIGSEYALHPDRSRDGSVSAHASAHHGALLPLPTDTINCRRRAQGSGHSRSPPNMATKGSGHSRSPPAPSSRAPPYRAAVTPCRRHAP